jgi:hypothetical protein
MVTLATKFPELARMLNATLASIGFTPVYEEVDDESEDCPISGADLGVGFVAEDKSPYKIYTYSYYSGSWDEPPSVDVDLHSEYVHPGEVALQVSKIIAERRICDALENLGYEIEAERLQAEEFAPLPNGDECDCGEPVMSGEVLCKACFAEDARLQAIADNADVYEEQAYEATLHRDEGPCGRAICNIHHVEVDAFGACHQCMDGIGDLDL